MLVTIEVQWKITEEGELTPQCRDSQGTYPGDGDTSAVCWLNMTQPGSQGERWSRQRV